MTLLSCRGLELCPRWHSKWVLQTGPNRLSVWSAFCSREHFCIVLSRKKSLETQRIRITSAKLWDATPQSLQGSLNTKYWCPGVTQMTKFRVAHYLNQKWIMSFGFYIFRPFYDYLCWHLEKSVYLVVTWIPQITYRLLTKPHLNTKPGLLITVRLQDTSYAPSLYLHAF